MIIKDGIAGVRSWVSIIIIKINAIDIVHETIYVIINSIAGNLASIDPEVRTQVGLCHVKSIVDYGNDCARSSPGDVPCQRRVYVGIHRATPQAAILMVPLVIEKRIVRNKLVE